MPCTYTSDRSRPDIALKGDVAAAHLLPVAGNDPQFVGIEPGVPRAVAQRLDDGPPDWGCEVKPDSASIAPSTASTPASTAASTLAAAIPLVSWV